MTTKKQREQAEALDNMREALTACGPNGTATLLIHDDGGRPSSTGRTHRLTVQVIESVTSIHPILGEGRCIVKPTVHLWLTHNAAVACGYRLAKDGSILMGGYGYSRSYQIASHLAHLAGHPLFVQTTGVGFAGPDGWVNP